MKQWMPLILALVMALFLAVFMFYLAIAVPAPAPIPKPSIYITRTDHFRTLDDEYVWLLEYTIDGVFQSPAFTSREAVEEFLEYLGTIGSVYQREAGL